MIHLYAVYNTVTLAPRTQKAENKKMKKIFHANGILIDISGYTCRLCQKLLQETKVDIIYK